MSCPVRTVCHPNKSCSRVHEPREAKGKDIIYLSEPSSLTDALFKKVYEIPHNVPVNTEALPAHIENPPLSGISWILAVKLESRKSATVHTILTRAGHFPSGKPKPGGTCWKPPRKKRCVCVNPCKYSWECYFGHTAEADHTQPWQKRSFLPKHLVFIWADTLSQAVYFMNPTCTPVPEPLCLCGQAGLSVCCRLKNSQISLISFCFHLQCCKCREISVT